MSTTSAAPAEHGLDAKDIITARASPAGFAWVADGRNETSDPEQGWLPYKHLLLLTDLLMRVASGEVKRAIVTMPPRHGKSQLISHYFPAWYLGTFPRRKVMVTSNTAHLAEDFGRGARDALEEFGPAVFGVEVRDDVAASSRWQTDQGGVFIAAGVGGTITGRGAHLLIVDDPIKNDKDAASSNIRDDQWKWWKGTARSRLATGGSAIVVQTRWHEDDLAGRMIQQSADDPEADQWTVLNLPAIAEEGDALGREVGEALCEALMTRDELLTTKRTVGSYQWASLYQQTPAPAEGMLFKAEHFRYWTMSENVDGQPFIRLHALDGTSKSFDIGRCAKFLVADTAASTKETADYSVVTTFLRTPDSDLIIWDLKARKFDLLQVPDFIEGVWKGQARAPLHVEGFGHGYGPVKTLRGRGVPVHDIQPVSDKVTRAMDAVARYEAHSVYHPQTAPWLDEFEAELLAFPNGAHDDMVDTISYGAIKLPAIASDDWKPIVKTRPGSRTRRPRTTARRAA
ncbi:phage terminase large subunit [Patulibacter minatonensis]|uniref:phage terminase large subunit n=1 Tax=Patulibacter minatonensis TaxID=298163 RepID=UPI000685690C|nr:phage terminase large subunit [Patulibacter minatonensis]